MNIFTWRLPLRFLSTWTFKYLAVYSVLFHSLFLVKLCGRNKKINNSLTAIGRKPWSLDAFPHFDSLTCVISFPTKTSECLYSVDCSLGWNSYLPQGECAEGTICAWRLAQCDPADLPNHVFHFPRNHSVDPSVMISRELVGTFFNASLSTILPLCNRYSTTVYNYANVGCPSWATELNFPIFI